eukprot:m.300895 g.300895  ORF g.300895 m.300895 type:complete len:415 (-) comp14557_c0_seq1:107-1351(-)
MAAAAEAPPRNYRHEIALSDVELLQADPVEPVLPAPPRPEDDILARALQQCAASSATAPHNGAGAAAMASMSSGNGGASPSPSPPAAGILPGASGPGDSEVVGEGEGEEHLSPEDELMRSRMEGLQSSYIKHQIELRALEKLTRKRKRPRASQRRGRSQTASDMSEGENSRDTCEEGRPVRKAARRSARSAASSKAPSPTPEAEPEPTTPTEAPIEQQQPAPEPEGKPPARRKRKAATVAAEAEPSRSTSASRDRSSSGAKDELRPSPNKQARKSPNDGKRASGGAAVAPKIYVCEECNRTFTHPPAHAQHVRSHSPSRDHSTQPAAATSPAQRKKTESVPASKARRSGRSRASDGAVGSDPKSAKTKRGSMAEDIPTSPSSILSDNEERAKPSRATTSTRAARKRPTRAAARS